MSGLSGGRGPALRRPPSDPTVGGVEAVQADLDAFLHHGFENLEPFRVAHAAAIGAVRPPPDGPPFQRSVLVALAQILDVVRRGRRPQDVLRPHARPGVAEQAETLLVISQVHRRRQLSGDAGAGLLELGDDFGCQLEIRLDAVLRHTGRKTSNGFVAGQGVKLRAEIAHLHQLYPGALDVV